MHSKYRESFLRHAFKQEDAGPLLVPELTFPLTRRVTRQGIAPLSTAMARTRWPSIHGGQLMSCAVDAATYSAYSDCKEGEVPQLVSVDFGFHRPLLRDQVRDGASVEWCTRSSITPLQFVGRKVAIMQVNVILTFQNTRLGIGSAQFAVGPTERLLPRPPSADCQEFFAMRPQTLLLPAYRDDCTPGTAYGYWDQAAPLVAVADSTFAHAMATIRGDGVPDGMRQDYVVTRYSYHVLQDVPFSNGRYQAQVDHIGRGQRTIASVTSVLSAYDTPVGVARGTLLVTQSPDR